MSDYAIICDARKGHQLDIDVLALVDRKRCKSSWWTSDDFGLIMRFKKKSAALFSCKRLRKNNARVVDYKDAKRYISEQCLDILHNEGINCDGGGWDGHK
jgi:hypothetical protein